MRKNMITGLILLLVLSIVSNGYLLITVGQMSKELKQNNNRVSYIEKSFDQSVRDLILEEAKSKDSDILEDVKFTVSDLTDPIEKKAMVDVEFKLKVMDSTENVYASIECGEEEPVLMEIRPVNDTTFKVEREICLLQPLRIDLVIEKYGEKKLINLITEEKLYEKFVGETDFNLVHFDYSYNALNKKIILNFATEIEYFPIDEMKLEEAYVSIEKNGVTINRLPLELRKDNSQGKTMDYFMEVYDLELLGLEKDEIKIAVILLEKNSFIHRYEFVKCFFEDGQENIVAESSPLLSLK